MLVLFDKNSLVCTTTQGFDPVASGAGEQIEEVAIDDFICKNVKDRFLDLVERGPRSLARPAFQLSPFGFPSSNSHIGKSDRRHDWYLAEAIDMYVGNQ